MLIQERFAVAPSRMSGRCWLFGLAFALVLGCDSSEPVGQDADVAGLWALTLTYGANGCAFNGWIPGQTVTEPGRFSISQDGDWVTAELEGWVALFSALVNGYTVYQGRVRDDALEMRIRGTLPVTNAGCTHVVDSSFVGHVDGDLMSGTVVWRSSDIMPAGCMRPCESTLALKGVRARQ